MPELPRSCNIWLLAIAQFSLFIESITEIVYQRFRELQIESPTPYRVERLIRHALSVSETKFCHQTLSQLTPAIKEQIDILLLTEETSNTEDESLSGGKLKPSDFAFLKTDPGPVGLGSFLTEIEKLKRIRSVGLPTDLLTGISPKLIQKYRQRAATESPYDLRQHPDAIRYTLMAAFCLKRSQEITDNLIEILIQIIQPENVETFIADLQQQMAEGLSKLDKRMPSNSGVNIIGKGKGLIRVSPFEPVPEPINLKNLKGEINRLWHQTSLLDILKETDLRVNFTRNFKSMGTREIISRENLQKRLLLCLYGMGTNTGLKRINTGINGENYPDLLYVRRRYIHKDQLRSAIASVINAIFEIRSPQIWGEGTTTCASDSKHFVAWEQNLMTQYHLRYGGRGVMIYWHVERRKKG